MRELGEVKQKSGKVVRAWAVAGDLDAGAIASNMFSLEWPPRSGRMTAVPGGGPGGVVHDRRLRGSGSTRRRSGCWIGSRRVRDELVGAGGAA